MTLLYPELARAHLRAYPLLAYRCAGWAAEWVTRHFGEFEIYNHAANQASKTKTASAIAAALARGLPSLKAFDGSDILLPQPPLTPCVTIGIGTPSYKLGEGSIIDYIRRFLGPYDVREGRTGAGTSMFHVKHRLSKDESEWSIIYVFPYGAEDPEEIRLNAWFADGPPPEAWLSAIRNRGKSDCPLYGVITATPAKANEWEPIRAQYPEEKLVGDARGRATIQSSVYDNRFLHIPGCPGYDQGVGYCACTCPAIVRQERANDGMADAPARLRGEHVNLVGGCPYAPELIQRWLDRCRDPLDVYKFVIQGERDGRGGLDAVALMCALQVWRDAEENDQYIVIVDVGRGIDDGRHDPDHIHVRSRRDRSLVARAMEYLGPWGLGMAALETAKAYRQAPIYVARGGGYGEAVLSALRIAGYRNVGHNMDSDKVKQAKETLGVTESAETRIKAMQAVASMLQRGRDEIPSRDVIRCFSNCIVDKAGKIVARLGRDPMTQRPYQDGDLVLAGHGNRILDLLGPPPAYVTRERTEGDEFRETLKKSGFRGVTSASDYRGPLDLAEW